VPDSALAGQQQMLIPTEVNVKFYPSTSVLDDVAWAGAALFLATGEEEFLGEAQVRGSRTCRRRTGAPTAEAEI
jgi:hypothetical protein